MANMTPDHWTTVALTIIEYVDGQKVNECNLKQEGAMPYMDTAKRVIEALGATDPAPVKVEVDPKMMDSLVGREPDLSTERIG